MKSPPARLRAARPSPLARPTAFRRPRLLIVGCGDVGLRVVRELPAHWQVRALSSSPQRHALLHQAGVQPIAGNLDDRASLHRLRSLAPRVLHLAPPPAAGATDRRTAALLAVLAQSQATRQLVYASTSGVYGDAGGARFDETRAVAPQSDRGRRRVDAERRVRAWSLACSWHASVLRIPGIYAGDRPGGHPRERLVRGTPVLAREDDVYTNHIHADDLARACIAALHRGRPQRVYHASDHTELKMGDYFDLAAALCGLPAPARIPRADAAQQLGAMQLSFMSESRRLLNHRLTHELRLRLRYPTVREGLVNG